MWYATGTTMIVAVPKVVDAAAGGVEELIGEVVHGSTLVIRTSSYGIVLIAILAMIRVGYWLLCLLGTYLRNKTTALLWYSADCCCARRCPRRYELAEWEELKREWDCEEIRLDEDSLPQPVDRCKKHEAKYGGRLLGGGKQGAEPRSKSVRDLFGPKKDTDDEVEKPEGLKYGVDLDRVEEGDKLSFVYYQGQRSGQRRVVTVVGISYSNPEKFGEGHRMMTVDEYPEDNADQPGYPPGDNKHYRFKEGEKPNKPLRRFYDPAKTADCIYLTERPKGAAAASSGLLGTWPPPGFGKLPEPGEERRMEPMLGGRMVTFDQLRNAYYAIKDRFKGMDKKGGLKEHWNSLQTAQEVSSTPSPPKAGLGLHVEFFTGLGMYPVFVHEFGQMEQSFVACAYQLDHTELCNKLMSKTLKEKVQGRIVMDQGNFRSSSCARQASRVEELFEAGCQLRTYRPPSGAGFACMHAKTWILDGATALTGSVNLTHNGLENNKEHLFRITNPECVHDMLVSFEELWEEAQAVEQHHIDAMKETWLKKKEATRGSQLAVAKSEATVRRAKSAGDIDNAGGQLNLRRSLTQELAGAQSSAGPTIDGVQW